MNLARVTESGIGRPGGASLSSRFRIRLAAWGRYEVWLGWGGGLYGLVLADLARIGA